VVVVRSAELGDWSSGFGVKELGGSEAPTADDQFRIGSNTKSMTSTVVLQLIQEGKVDFDDPISTYRAGVPNGDEITIEQLMMMRTGLFSYTATPEWIRAVDATPQKVWTPDELLALGDANPPKFAPGAGWDYSNNNTVLLGLVIEEVTGMSLAQNFEERIFEPLGLTSTLLPPADVATIPGPHAHGYRFGTFEESLMGNRGVLSPEDQAAAVDGTLVPNDVTDTNPSFAWAAGGVISTPNELARYVKALVDGGLLDDEMQHRRIVDKLVVADAAVNPDYRYGYNIDTSGPFIGHGGDIPGFNSVMYHDPERDLTVIAYATINVTPTGKQSSDQLMHAVVEELYPA
jgi:D-alanyl-D-alanine carboxypeptidase